MLKKTRKEFDKEQQARRQTWLRIQTVKDIVKTLKDGGVFEDDIEATMFVMDKLNKKGL